MRPKGGGLVGDIDEMSSTRGRTVKSCRVARYWIGTDAAHLVLRGKDDQGSPKAGPAVTVGI
jgi:hypothetical protein